MTQIDSLTVGLSIDASGFAAGANQALQILQGLQDSINGVTRLVLPVIAGISGLFTSAKALESFASFSGTNAEGFATVAAGAAEYKDALKGAGEAASELSAVVGQALAPAATASLEAFKAIAPIIGAVVVHTMEFYSVAKEAIVGIVTGWLAGFGAVGSMWESTINYVSTGINVLRGVMENWKILAQVAFLSVALGAVQFGSQVVHVLTEVIPKTLTWFADNWVDVFYTAFDYVTTILINLGQNVRDFFSALWNAITGGDFDFKFTPLTEGFKSTLKSLPEIAEREIGTLEKDLQAQLEGAVGVAVEQMAPFVGPDKDITAGLTAFADNIAGFFAPLEGGNLKTELAGESTKNVKAAVFGSKDAYDAIVKATGGGDKQDKANGLLAKIVTNTAKKPQKAKI